MSTEPAPIEAEQPLSLIDRFGLIVQAFDATSPTLGLNELTERCCLPKSTVHRVADQMISSGWLERTPIGYRLGSRFLDVGGLVLARQTVTDRALPHLHDLQVASGHSVQLAVLDHGSALLLNKIWGHGGPATSSRIGDRLPLHCTALGKALSAFCTEPEHERLLNSPLERHTGRTTIQPYLLEQQLATARTVSWTFDDEEHAVGIRCVAAPVRGAGRAVAAVSICGPAHLVEMSKAVPLVRRAAADIWGELFRRKSEDARSAPDDGRAPWGIEQWRRWLDGVAGEWM